MAIELKKGQRAGVAPTGPGSKKLIVGLGWDMNASNTGGDFDLDASAFMLGPNQKLVNDEYFIFYNNLKSPDCSVEHTGDNRTGEGEGDDEQIIVDLSQLDATEVVFAVTIHEGGERGQNFGQVRNAFIRIIDAYTNEELARYDLDEDFSVETAVEFGRLYLKNGEWKFHAIGQGYSEGLEFLLSKYS